MKKLKLLIFTISFLLQMPAFAQVQVDHPLQFTGNGSNARVSGIHAVIDSADAASAAVIQNGNLIYATATGNSNNFSITISPPVAGYQKGMVFNFISNQTVTGAATLNVNNLGAIPITKYVNRYLSGCEIYTGQAVTVLYDGTNFQMTSVIYPVAVAGIPIATAGTGAGTTQITANWDSAANATGYYLDVATDSGFANFVSGYNNLDAGNITTYNVTGLTCGSAYYYRVRSTNACGPGSNSNTISIGTSSCFSPATISGLTLWFDADDPSTFTYSSGNLISVWADKSGYHNNVSNSNTSEQPVTVANDINGLQAVRFTGSTNSTYLANATFAMNVANRSVFIVIEENDAHFGDSRWISILGSNSDWNSNNGYEIQNATYASHIAVFQNISYFAPHGGTTYAPLNIYTDIANAGSGTLYQGGVPSGTGDNTSASTSVGGLAIGAQEVSVGNIQSLLDGDIGEIIVFSRALTSTERDEVGAYLSAKWGIPFTP